MSRRSQRLISRGLPESNVHQVIFEEPESTSKLKAATVRKPTRRSIKRMQGKPGQMMDMPLEVILEICGHLLPKDLLNLSRTSKGFRSLLMSRRSKLIWKAVCSNLPGLPPCPPDLTEPAYINLMFDAHCHSCLKKNCDRVYLLWKARLCESCRNSPDVIVKITSEFQLQFSQMLGSPSHTIFDVLPVDYNLLYKPQVDAFVKLLNGTPAEEHTELLNARQRFISDMGKHNRLLAKWRESEKVARQEELNRRRKERQEAILEKLKEEGWKEEVDYMDQIRSEWERFKLLPHLRTSQALTPRIWTNIKRDLTRYMKKLRNKRIVESRRWTVGERLMQLYNFLRNPEGPRDFPATPREIALFVPEVYRSITPDEPNFNVEGLHAPIKDYLEMRSQKARELLRDLILRKCNVDESCDPFSLAVGSLFVCLDCRFRDALSLERAVDHRCDRHRTVKRPSSMSVEIYDYIDAGASTTGTSVWREDWYHRSISTLVGVVKACGLDPGVATIQDLDRADVRLRCASHDHQSSDPRPIMTWRTAAIYSARQQSCKVFERATEAEAAAAKPLEAAALRAWVEWWESAGEYRCNHCRPWSQPWNYRGSGMSKHKVITHIQYSHEIAEPTESDWTDDHDTIQIPNPVYLVSEKLRHTPRRRDSCQDQELDHLLNAGLATYFEFE